MFEANYSLAQVGVRMLKYAAGVVIDDAPADFQNSSAYRLLRAATEAARVPPDLPASLSQVREIPSPEDVERALDGLRLAAETLSAEAAAR